MATDSTSNVSISLTATLFIDVQQLLVSGTYKILINPAGPTTNSVTCTVYDVPADITGSITPGGPPVIISNTIPGQNAKLFFDGTAGQNLSFVDTHGDFGLEVIFINPNSTVLKQSNGAFFFSNFIEGITLPVTGTYTIILNPGARRCRQHQLQASRCAAGCYGQHNAGRPACKLNHHNAQSECAIDLYVGPRTKIQLAGHFLKHS